MRITITVTAAEHVVYSRDWTDTVDSYEAAVASMDEALDETRSDPHWHRFHTLDDAALCYEQDIPAALAQILQDGPALELCTAGGTTFYPATPDGWRGLAYDLADAYGAADYTVTLTEAAGDPHPQPIGDLVLRYEQDDECGAMPPAVEELLDTACEIADSYDNDSDDVGWIVILHILSAEDADRICRLIDAHGNPDEVSILRDEVPRQYVPVTLRQIEAAGVPLDAQQGIDVAEHAEMLEREGDFRLAISPHGTTLHVYEHVGFEPAEWRECVRWTNERGERTRASVGRARNRLYDLKKTVTAEES